MLLASATLSWSQPTSADTAHWLEYNNTSIGFSFRYPSFMTVKEDKLLARQMTAQAVETVIDLIAETYAFHEKTPIFRFIVYKRKPANPPADLYWPSDDHRLCKLSRYLNLDGHKAFFCESCGGLSGRCDWHISILQPRICNMFPMYNGPELDGSHPEKGPQDAGFPILSIIKTVHFRATN